MSGSPCKTDARDGPWQARNLAAITQMFRDRRTAKTPSVDLKIEVVVAPASDFKPAKGFYGGLGWRLYADFANGEIEAVAIQGCRAFCGARSRRPH